MGTSFRCQDYVDNRSRVHAGHVGVGIDPKLAQRVADADLLLVVGSRLGEMTTGGYTLVEPPLPRQTLVHVHPGAEELGRVFQPTLPIHAGSPEFAAAALDACVVATQSPARRAWVEAAHADYLATLEPVSPPGALNLSETMRMLRERLPDDAILTNGAGNFAVWAHRFFPFHGYRSQLAPTSGAMGYGLPAAIAAKIAEPRRIVVCIAGDGDFLMSGQELATAVHERRRGDRARRRQRHVRDDPDAPGARVPGSRRRHVAHEPRLRRASPARSARMARRSSAPRTSGRRSSAALAAGRTHCSTCASTPRGSLRRQPLRRSERDAPSRSERNPHEVRARARAARRL